MQHVAGHVAGCIAERAPGGILGCIPGSVAGCVAERIAWCVAGRVAGRVAVCSSVQHYIRSRLPDTVDIVNAKITNEIIH